MPVKLLELIYVVNLRIKGQSERQQAFIWDPKKIAICEALIQAEP